MSMNDNTQFKNKIEPMRVDGAGGANDYLENEEIEEEDSDFEQEELMRQKMEQIVSRLERTAEDLVGRRSLIETRWITDLTLYHGEYDSDTKQSLLSEKRSQLFFNLTRAKTNAWEARLSDMLFPTDDRNWGIQPTPVPEIASKAKTDPNPNDQQAVIEQGNAKNELVRAREASELMEAEIDDQLKEGRYSIKCRDVIHDGCKLGIGILKGPVKSNKVHKKWSKVLMEDQSEVFSLVDSEDGRPIYTRVDPWNYFPDMDSATPDEAEFTFERHLMNKKELKRLARAPGFNKQAIKDLAREKPRTAMPDYIAKLRAIAEINENLEMKYHIWEYHGPLDAEDMISLCECLGDEAKDLIDDPEDMADEIEVVMWFCQGHLLKFGIHQLDSDESIYSVFNLEKDETSQFGYGVPYLMRDSQKALNAAWRMMMDNGAVSAGPQVLIDRNKVEPQDGQWALRPFKIWTQKEPISKDSNPPFSVFNIQGNQAELAAIIQMARQFADDETSLPLIAQGEQGSHTTQTQGGMSILMNSVNVVFRRVVKNWDDDITRGVIRRIYDWNMQFSTREEIKGDFEVDARGSSVLLVKEMQAQNLMIMANQFIGHPVIGPLVKNAELMRKLCQAHMISADEIIKTDEEIKAELEQLQQQQQGQEPEQDPSIVVAQMRFEGQQMEVDARIQVANMNKESAMMELAAKQNMKLDEIEAMLERQRIIQNSNERKLAAEIGAQKNNPQFSGGGGSV